MEPIAIIGVGCRFPGAKNPQAFWHLLQNGVDAVSEVPCDRWDIDAYYDCNPATPGKMNTRWGGFLEHVDQFDPAFFNISPREAERMDPQQRLFLEVSWEALEYAGVAPDQLAGTPTGVFVGIASINYDRLLYKGVHDFSTLSAYDGIGTTLSLTANRLSYLLNLRGPSLAIETACSSSLVTVHLACQSLRSQETNLCLVGGVNLLLSPELNIIFSQARMMASDGRCKTFDASADGYVRGEGCGVVVLKRLADARTDGDNVLAVVRGSAVNQDGLSNGITAPNGPSQQAVIRQALINADVEPAQISYVEAHGTGTKLGDPIEFRSLKAVLAKERTPEQPCWVGSVKTNFGHLEGAAGIAGLIKTVLALQHRTIPPHLHLTQLNPYISLKNTPFSIPTRSQPWSIAERRFAGVSAFSFGGTNCHIILEEAPETSPASSTSPPVDRPLHLLALSAKDEPALRQLANAYAETLETPTLQASKLEVPNLCFTANTGRSHFDRRLAVISDSPEQLQAQLRAIASGKAAGAATRPKRPKIAFLFTGQGSQYAGMGRQLYETQPTFRQALDRCDAILSTYLERSLLEVLYPRNEGDSPLNATLYTQPALFALEYALVQLWQSWGITPNVVLGHSVGEYAAACAAGVFSLEDGLKLIANRAQLMQALPGDGGMLAVFAAEHHVRAMMTDIDQPIAAAAINGPALTILSGHRAALRAIAEKCQTDGIKTQKLRVSHAFHSPLMQPMLLAFEGIAREVTYAQPRIPLISNVTGNSNAEINTPEYWTQHVLQPVQFQQSVATLAQQEVEIFIEIGPHPTLLGMCRQCLTDGIDLDYALLPSLRREQDAWVSLLQSLGTLYRWGIPVDWRGFDRDYARHRQPLPTYPWQRQRYWSDAVNSESVTPSPRLRGRCDHPLLGQRLYSALPDIQFETQIRRDTPTYLAHHCICKTAVLPAAGYIEMILAAGAAVFKSDQLLLEEMSFQQALTLAADEHTTLQVIVTPTSEGAATFKILSLSLEADSQEPQWTLHACGSLRKRTPAHLPSVDLATLRTQYPEAISIASHYQQFRHRQMDYGPSFQAVVQLWKQTGQVLGQIHLPDDLIRDVEQYQLHPVLLDACFQMLGSLLLDQDDRAAYLPVGIERLHVYQRPGPMLWSQAQLVPDASGSRSLTAEICLFNPNGTLVAKIEALSLRQIRPKVLQRIFQKEADRLLPDDPCKRQEQVASYLKQLLTQVTGHSSDHLDWQKPLSGLGIESLMAADLRQRIEAKFGISVPIEYLATLSIEQFLNQILLMLDGHAPASSQGTPVVPETDLWLPYRAVNAKAHMRLFCLPYAGAGASVFQAWSALLPPEIEVCPIQLPGREHRLGETPITRMKLMLQTLAPLLHPYLDKPFAFFGHSMGALLSFELVRDLRKRGWPSPKYLFVSGSRAPQCPDLEPPIYRLPDAQFKDKLRRFKRTSETVLQSPELMQLFLPALRADFELLDTYFYTNEAPLDLPIAAFGGQDDPKVSHMALAGWRAQTHQDFSLDLLPGDHFFLQSAEVDLVTAIARNLQQLLVMT